MSRTIELHPGESVTLADGTVVRAVFEHGAAIPSLHEPSDLVLLIKARGLTQQQIEAVTGISQSTLSKIETGARKDIRYSNYRTLVGLLQSLPEG